MENQTNKYRLEKNQSEKNEKKGPLKSFKAIPVRVTIWENPTNKEDNSTFKSISLDRVYKDKQGEWQKSNTLRVSDLPKAAVVLNKAYEYIISNPGEGLGRTNT
ncbi:MAG: hypothetical protein ACQESF_07335 [Nanobdellota archaeon]